MSRYLLMLVALLSVAATAFGNPPRRIMFARCEEGVTMPKAVFMTCENRRNQGSCSLKKDNTYTLTAIFRSEMDSEKVESMVLWNNNFFPVPLPGQETNACKTAMKCPVKKQEISRMQYHLHIDTFWPPKEFPVIWYLTDKESGEDIACFRFKISIF